MKFSKKILYLSVCAFVFVSLFSSATAAQDRPRVVATGSSQPINQPTNPPDTDRTRPLTSSRPVNSPNSRPTLTNEIVVQPKPAESAPLVKKTGESRPMSSLVKTARPSLYNGGVTSSIMDGITSRLGIPYLYGATGPNRYDCSGFVWAVFKDAGIDFERTSARSLWAMSTPVEGDERYRFGTLVFLNNLGHIGIVADEKGFYHASRSKGITYSPFAGYWEKRIVGFRKLNVEPRPADTFK